jgi:YebC/PmpR family DNA-binding regulatory protein
VLTDNRNRAAANVRNAFTKGGGNMGTTGCVSFQFDEKGLIMVETDCGMDEETLMLLSVDAGAEDFVTQSEGYEIITEPDAFSAVREALETASIEMAGAEVTMLPQVYATLTDPEDIKKMRKMLDLLDDEDDVQSVYHNWENEE